MKLIRKKLSFNKKRATAETVDSNQTKVFAAIKYNIIREYHKLPILPPCIIVVEYIVLILLFFILSEKELHKIDYYSNSNLNI